jgi:hypothetical protein
LSHLGCSRAFGNASQLEINTDRSTHEGSMKTKRMAAGLVVMCALLSGCARDDWKSAGGAAEAAAESGRTSSHTFAFEMAGIMASSRVEHRVVSGGGEALHGTTSVTLAGAAHPVVLDETAQIDASGRLVLATAELRSGPHAAQLVRSIRLDAAAGAVKVRDEKGERSWRVPSDQPWIYQGLFSDIAPESSDVTAVQAWVARRAAHSAERLREVHVAGREHHLTVADQVAFADGSSEWIVLGDEAIETDEGFVRTLRWKALEEAGAAIQKAELSCDPGPV